MRNHVVAICALVATLAPTGLMASHDRGERAGRDRRDHDGFEKHEEHDWRHAFAGWIAPALRRIEAAISDLAEDLEKLDDEVESFEERLDRVEERVENSAPATWVIAANGRPVGPLILFNGWSQTLLLSLDGEHYIVDVRDGQYGPAGSAVFESLLFASKDCTGPGYVADRHFLGFGLGRGVALADASGRMVLYGAGDEPQNIRIGSRILRNGDATVCSPPIGSWGSAEPPFYEAQELLDLSDNFPEPLRIAVD